MKRMPVAIIACFALFFGSIAYSADAARRDENSAGDEQRPAEKGNADLDMNYAVSVSVTELGNRTLAATVRNHQIIIDQPREFGADDKGPTPPEYLAISFGSCIVSTLQLIAMRNDLAISDISVVVEGSIDFSKAMGVSDNNRAGFSGLTATVDFSSSLDEEAKKKLIDEVARVGAALDNIENTTPVQYRIR